MRFDNHATMETLVRVQQKHAELRQEVSALAQFIYVYIGNCATRFSSQENRLPWRDRHPSGERFHTCPAQPDALGFLSLAVQAAGYTVHGEFVLGGIVGTSPLWECRPVALGQVKRSGPS